MQVSYVKNITFKSFLLYVKLNARRIHIIGDLISTINLIMQKQ